MPLTVLRDSDVRSLLLSLTREEILDLQKTLAGSLRDYSLGAQDVGCCAANQPQRTAIIRKDGLTTLFLPATAGDSIGMKIVSLADGGEKCAKFNRTGSEFADFETQSASTGSLDGSLSSRMSSLSTDSSTSLSPKGPEPGIGYEPSKATSAKGTITLLDPQGSPFALINAHELTAFRTALTSLMMFNRREHVHTITVFGAGKQAYWHIRLALLLRGSEIKHVNIINRSFERATDLLKEFYSSEHTAWRSDVKFAALSWGYGEFNRLLKDHVRKADVVFCCTPSLEPLFPPEFLTSSQGKRKGRLVVAIGSYKPTMLELHPEILRAAVQPHDPHKHHFHKHAQRGGVVIVDSLEGSLKEAGEIVQAGLRVDQLVEVGELLIVGEASKKAVEQGGEGEKGLQEWIQKGNVIYKSVGLGLMDLVVGGDIVRLARQRGVGTTIEDF